MSSKLLADPRRIVTGHDASGNAIVLADGPISCELTPNGTRYAVLYETHEFPSSNAEPWTDPSKERTKDLVNEKGVVLRVVDFPPKKEGMFHRTISLDFGILHHGEITCHLDNNERIDMKEGDVCIQRGTIHGWTNYSDRPARLYFVLTAAQAIEVDGKALPPTGYDRKHVQSGGQPEGEGAVER